MAEAVLLSLASTILSTAASALPAKECSSLIWGPEKELQRLEGTMKTIQARLDAVQKRGSSIAAADAVIVKDWMERIGDVLHEADDLFDEVAANELLKEPMGENKLLKEVKVSLSNLNAPISNYSILEKIKDIRERFEDIEKVVAFPNLLQLQPEEPLRAGIVGTGPFINPQEIVGREGDLQALRDFLLGYTTGEDTVPVIAIVGIGGIGKTTLAQLICGDTAVNTKFEKIWWADVPAVYTEADVLSRIFQSIEKKSYGGEPSLLRARVSELVTKTKADPGNYLLILDGVQDQRGFKWCDIIGLLSTGAKGSRIIVTTRYQSVANAMHAAKTCILEGLSVSSSKKLFDRIAMHAPDYFEFQSLTRLRYLELVRCPSVVRLDLAPAEHSVLQELQIEDCPLLGTYGLKEDAILDWARFPKLQLLTLDKEKMQRDYYQPISIEREEAQD